MNNPCKLPPRSASLCFEDDRFCQNVVVILLYAEKFYKRNDPFGNYTRFLSEKNKEWIGSCMEENHIPAKRFDRACLGYVNYGAHLGFGTLPNKLRCHNVIANLILIAMHNEEYNLAADFFSRAKILHATEIVEKNLRIILHTTQRKKQ